MAPRIAIVGAGAVGGYAGAHMVHADHDVTFIDGWPEHVEAMRRDGLTITHLKDIAPFNVKVRALHITDVQGLAKEKPIDIAFICMKSYDTAWSTAMIKPYLADGGYVVSLQNCINEPVIASIVGEDRTLGSIASSITVELTGPGQVFRAAGKSGKSHTVFRVGQPDGKITDRVQRSVRSGVAHRQRADDHRSRRRALDETDAERDGQRRLRLHRAEGPQLDRRRSHPPVHGPARLRMHSCRTKARAQAGGDVSPRPGDHRPRRRRRCRGQAHLRSNRLDSIKKPGGGEHRPSMGQDMVKGRRTEIEFMNGLVVEKGKEVGIPTPANAVLTNLVKRVERGELTPDKSNITGLRESC